MIYNITFLVILINTSMDKLYNYCKQNKLEEIKKLNLSIEDIRSDNNCALRWACRNGHIEVVKFLIDKGLTLEDIRSEDNFALRCASKNGHLEVVKFLIN